MYLPERIAKKVDKIYRLLLKMHNTASSIGFIKKCIHFRVTPKFAQIKGQFLKKSAQSQAERKLMLDHILNHLQTLQKLSRELRDETFSLEFFTGKFLCRALIQANVNKLQQKRLDSFRVKNRKLRSLIGNNSIAYVSSYCIPIVNISDTELTEKEERALSFGLEHSFVDKNKSIKSFLAANLEGVAESVDKAVDPNEKENFHEFLRAYTDMFTKNVHNT